MKFENTETWGFKHALRGMRNPMNSWDKRDSECDIICATCCYEDYCEECQHTTKALSTIIGENDLDLARRLIKAGPEHRKFLRQIFVSVDITAPFYWWKEFDTYKVGTVANSCSTMHKIASAPITVDCFEIDDCDVLSEDGSSIDIPSNDGEHFGYAICNFIDFLEGLRQEYLRTKDKKFWKELIRWLPESWLQKRTVTMNYENIMSMIHQRKNHKLNEWSGKDNPELTNFISWAKTLPYAKELLLVEEA